MSCNICGCNDFRDVNGRKSVLCCSCGGYERTRLMKAEIDRLLPLEIRRNLRCLHIAPEYGLCKAIRSTFLEYIPADIDVKRYSHIEGIRYIDLCDRDSINQFYQVDCIIHAHVIEHIPCNYVMSLLRLHRLLTPKGRQFFSVPIYGNFYEESLADLTSLEREARFGQFDHVRKFSEKDIQFTIGAIFKIPTTPILNEFYSVEFLKSCHLPIDILKTYSGHYCFSPDSYDILL